MIKETVMGKYVEENLTKDEQVIHETSNHWMIFLSPKAVFTLFMAPIIQITTSEYAITNKRVIIKIGLFSRKTLEMNLQKIESVNVLQGVLGRMLGYGTIVIVGTGGTREPFSYIKNPLKFRKQFQELS